MPTYFGRCLCGQMAVEFVSRLPRSEFHVRACQCGYCRKHGAEIISDATGLVRLSVPRDTGNRYRFGHAITDFHVCNRCGVYVAASWADEGGTIRAVINRRCLDDAAAFGGPLIAADFDGETVAERTARRQTSWTPATIRETD